MHKNIKVIKIVLAVAILVISIFPSTIGFISISTKPKVLFENTYFNAINIDETTIKITINPMDFDFGALETKNGYFATIKIPNFAFTMVKGEAKLPVIRRMIEIPYESNPQIIVSSISWEYASLYELNLPSKIIPAQDSFEKIPDKTDEFVIDEDYYLQNYFVPGDIARIVHTGEIRGRRFALVEISPVQYKPLTGEIKKMNSCVLTIDLPNSNMEKTYENIERYTVPSYESLFSNIFENSGFYEKEFISRTSEGYLIIVYDDFYEEIQPLVAQKESKGFIVTTTKTSDIPGGATQDNIYNYIEDAYDSWNTPPAYVLLVGDTPQIPTYTGSSSYSEADLYYVTVDGSDYIPDIYIGRFPGSQEAHIEAMVDKTVYYEKGVFNSYEWIKKAAFIASSDQGQLAEETHNYVIDNFLDPNGYICDKIYQASGGSTTDIYNSLNEGRSLCIYSGHGSPTGWSCVPFDQYDVGNLENEGMYPFVCSHACSTNTFGDSECFGETWLRKPDKAAVAFWGASASTYWDEDDILERAMFQSWWEDGLDWLGGMTDMALIYLYENYSGGGFTKYYFEAYNLNGDPSLKIWINNPSNPPETPTKPDGPDAWTQYVETTFTSITTDPDGDDIYYLFDWGDGTDSGWIGPYQSGQTGEAAHTYEDLGTFEIRAISKDSYNALSDWSEPHTISIVENEPPEGPTIDGQSWGLGGKKYDFNFVSTDADGHDIYYKVSWDDGEDTGWLGPYSSGEEITLEHSWNQKGEYWIKAWAKDILDGESTQSSFKITIFTNGKTKQNIVRNLNPAILKILEFFILNI
ncbi:hypothetical protein AYK24_00975 [Thermoplasmatales archaeon SG8-52-4]|nr:MAG: hypothetical protein AYK24_00975 [Thermoplasmatales archaeon SG8-52-4]